MKMKIKIKGIERMQSTRTGNHAKSRIKRKRKLAGLLALALLLSNAPVMQLTAAPVYMTGSETASGGRTASDIGGTEINVATGGMRAGTIGSNIEDTGEGSENYTDIGSTGEGSEIGQDTRAASKESGPDSDTGNTGEGKETGSDTGNADEGRETGSDTGNADEGRKPDSDTGNSDEESENGSDTGDSGEGTEPGSNTGNAGGGNAFDPDAGNTEEDNENEENTAGPEEDSESDGDADDTEEEEELPGTGKNDKKTAGAIESLSEEEIAAQRELVPDNLPEMEVLEMPEHYDASQDIYRPSFYGADDTAYDSRAEGILTPIRNQNPWGSCWAFATLGTMEISLVMQELADKDTVDLSERHLAYFTYHTGNDVLGNAAGDTVDLTGGLPYLNRGGNMSRASLRLMNWQGAAAEADYPYSNEGTMEDLSVESAQDNVYHMRDCFFLDTKANDPETIQNIKALVRQYGGVFWSYRDEDTYYNSNTHAYYNYEQNNTNHAIMIVGWDDDFPKENFKKEPENNGAWIVRNSWSERWGDAGYFYISYEDVSLGAGNPASVAVAEAGDNYDNNYFNSNTVAWSWRYGMKMAQVYSLKGLSTDRETVRAVSFMTGSTNRNYTIQIYKNPEMTNGVVTDPESGTAMLETELAGRISYAGVYTVDLPEPIICNADDKIAIVIYFSDGGYGYIYKDLSEENSSSNIRNHNVTHAGESFYSRTLTGSWVDMHEDGESLRINLLTDNVEGEAAIVVKASVVSPKHMNDTYKVDLRWNKIFGASDYEIYRAETIDGTYEKVGVSDASERQYQDAIEQADYAEHYYYKVRAVFSDGSDRCSDSVEAGLTAEIVFDHFTLAGVGAVVTLSWDTVTGAAGYEIERKEKKDDSYRMLTRIEDVSCVEYADDLSEQEPGIYQYRIRAYSAEGKYTEWAQQEFVMDLKITQIDYQTLQFSWPPVEDAYLYYVYIGVGGRFYGLGYYSAQNVSKPYNLPDMLAKGDMGTYHVGDDYTYYARILDSNKSEIYRTTRVSFRTVPDALEIETIERTETAEDAPAVKLTWSGGGGADTVTVYRSEDPENKGEVYATATAEDGTYTDAAVETGKTYYYWLCPTVLNSAGQTVEGETTAYSRITVTEIEYMTQMKSAQAVSDTEVMLTWEENADADGYYLYRRGEDDTNVSLIAVLEKGVTSYKDTELTSGDVYTYRIAVYVVMDGEKQPGKKSEEMSVRTNPAKVLLREAVLSDTGSEITLKWEEAQGAEGYVVERALAGGEHVRIATVESHDSVTYTDDQLSDVSGKVSYRVTAYHGAVEEDMQYGQPSNEISVKIVTELTEIRLLFDGVNVVLSWDAPVAVAGYEIQRKEQGDGDYTTLIRIGDPSCTEYTDDLSGKAPGIWQYRVCAYGADGEYTSWVEEEVVKDLKITQVDHQTLKFSWIPVENATACQIYIEDEHTQDLFFSKQTQATSVTCNMAKKLGAGNFRVGDSYTYHVLLLADESQPELYRTSSVSFRTVPDALEVESVEDADDGTSVTLTWSGGEGADTVVIYRSEDPEDQGETYDAVPVGDGSYTDSSVEIGRTYYYRLCPTVRNSAGESIGGTVTGPTAVKVENLIKAGIWMKDIPAQTYTGKAIKPEVAVYDDAKRLTLKKDYTVIYKNNINAGTARVIIKGKGDYAETIEGTFVINSRPLDAAAVSAPEYLLYNHKEQAISVTVKDGNKKLSSKKDYTQTIICNGAEVSKAKEAGTYQITITGRGNYTGEVTAQCEVVENRLLLGKASVKLPSTSLRYQDGEEVTFDESEISVKLSGKPVPQREEDGTVNYTVSYRNNTAVGTATVVITAGEGSRYAGICSKNFKVVGTALSTKTINITGIKTSVIYTGDPIFQDLILTDKASGETLEESVDYRITYGNHVNAGKASVTLTGLGRYSGTIRKTYTISKAKLTEDMIRSKIVTAQQNRAGATPDIEIAYMGRTLVKGQDYTLSYTNNKNITTDQKKAYITVTGKGNYSGKLKNIVELQIAPKAWQSDDITIEVPDMKYSKNKREYKPVPVVCDNGRKLVKNKDYTVTYEANKKDDIGNIPAAGHVATVIITAKSADYADGTDSDIRRVEFRIIEKMIGDAKVQLVNPQYFSQYGVVPGQDDLHITHKGTPVAADEYEIISYSNNTKKGKASLVIRGKGQYGGTKKVTFAIKAKGMKTNLADAVANAVSTLMEAFQ